MLNKLLSFEIPCGFRLGDDLWINHLQFANNTLICCANDTYQMDNIVAVLESFLAISGLKQNYSKSHVFGCNISHEDIIRAASVLDVVVGQLPIKY